MSKKSAEKIVPQNASYADVAAKPSIHIRDAWADHTGEFAKAMCPGTGFSFLYDGKRVGPELSEGWCQIWVDCVQGAISKVVLTHSSGLTVTRETRSLPGGGAIEYRLYFKNTAEKVLPPLSALEALDLSFGGMAAEGNCVISSGGGLSDGFLPPRNFALRKNYLAPTVPDAGTVNLTTEGGRSSNKDLPFFFVQNNQLQEGLFVAFGWTGQWAAAVQRDPAIGTISVRGRIPELQIALEPGEEIQGPVVLVGLYKGTSAEGSNALRRLIRDQYTPKLDGCQFLPIATYNHWWNIFENFDEALLMKLTDAAAAIDQEYFLLDAAWFEAPEGGKGFLPGVGNWELVDRNKLPNGLEAVADYVRSKGLKFGLWFEPERVGPLSKLAMEHPDWVLWDHTQESEGSFNAGLGPGFGLLDYGRPEVRQWVCAMLDHYIREIGVKYIRYDFNIDPLPYWDAHDEPNRRGITQLRHVQGLYTIIDWVRTKHPDTVLEGCSSGGRRIDLETARRFHTYLISDYTVDTSIIRFHLFGINHFLPGNYHYVEYTLPSPNQKAFLPDDLSFQSLFGGAFGTGGRVDLWSKHMTKKAQLHVQIWKQLRRYLVEDYYSLSSQPGDLESWSGWQFQDPKNQSGFIQTFRTRTPHATHPFVLHKLDEKSRYRFTDVYGKESFDVAGSTAMTKGIEITQEAMTSRVFTYAKMTE